MSVTEEYRRLGLPKQKDINWASSIRILNPLSGKTIQRIQLGLNEMAFSLEQCRCISSSLGEAMFLFVGVVQDMQLHPRSHSGCAILTYRFYPQGGRLEFLHRTKVDDIPLAFCGFDGWVAAGAGSTITLYEVGQKQLLRKCELKGLPSLVTFLKMSARDTFVVGDSHESVYFVQYSRQDNSFAVFADDVLSRMCTVGEVVDAHTCAAADKFGNFFVLRLPPGATGSDPKSKAAQSRTALWDQGNLGGAPHKLDLLAHFFVGEVVTGIQKCALGPGRSDLLLYGTVGGTIGAFVPFASRDDLDFFAHLELHMRKHFKNIIGRDHLQFRSYYTPVKCVIDGDLCEMFIKLPADVKTKIAREMDRTVDEVTRRLDEMRGNVLW
jgi:splicing factor 3B subunit 3